MRKLRPLPQRSLALLKFIIRGIRSGRLEHHQESFHCGTAHCIAGYVNILEYTKTAFNVSPRDFEPLTHRFGVEIDYASYIEGLNNFLRKKLKRPPTRQHSAFTLDEWAVAAIRLGLTPAEQILVFGAYRILDQIEETVGKLATHRAIQLTYLTDDTYTTPGYSGSDVRDVVWVPNEALLGSASGFTYTNEKLFGPNGEIKHAVFRSE